MTPIMAAAINGDWEAVEFLMDRKAELDNKDLKDQSIVHLAAQYDQHELIENLLDHKRTERDFMVNENDQYVSFLAEINLIFLYVFTYQCQDNTPLHIASQNGFLETVKVL